MNNRKDFIGSSDISIILGINPWKQPIDLWLEKTSIEEETVSPEKQLILDRGKFWEPHLITLACEEHNLEVVATNTRHVHPDVPHFASEIDATLAQEINLEIKTAHPRMANAWGETGTDSVPLYYAAQVQWGLGVTGRAQSLLYAAIGFDDRRLYTIERDEEIIEEMFRRAAVFWQLVQSNTPPEPNYEHPGVTKALKRLYGALSGDVLQAEQSDINWRAVYQEASARAKEYENVVDGAKAHLMARMGNADRLLFDDGKEFRRKLVKKNPYMVEKQEFVDFRLVNSKEERL